MTKPTIRTINSGVGGYGFSRPAVVAEGDGIVARVDRGPGEIKRAKRAWHAKKLCRMFARQRLVRTYDLTDPDSPAHKILDGELP